MPSIAKGELPYRVIKLATDMFARETGFSGPELHDLFAEHPDALGAYKGFSGGGESRWQLFQTGLRSMQVDRQRALLLELCSYEDGCRHGMPSNSAIAKLRSLLLADAAPGASVASEGLPRPTQDCLMIFSVC